MTPNITTTTTASAQAQRQACQRLLSTDPRHPGTRTRPCRRHHRPTPAQVAAQRVDRALHSPLRVLPVQAQKSLAHPRRGRPPGTSTRPELAQGRSGRSGSNRQIDGSPSAAIATGALPQRRADTRDPDAGGDQYHPIDPASKSLSGAAGRGARLRINVAVGWIQ
jgi:hypothetical protein